MLKAKLLNEKIKIYEDFSIDDLIERLILIEKIENGRKQSASGQTVSESKLYYEIEKWFENRL